MAVQNLQELVLFGLKAGELIAGVADGVGFDDVAKLLAVAKTAGPAFQDAGLALSEYANMSDAEAVGLETYVMANFDIKDDAVESAVVGALKVVMELHGLAKLFVKGNA